MVFISAIVVNTHQCIGLRKMSVTPAHLESLHQSWGERATHVQQTPFAKRSTLSSSWPTADQRWPQSSPNRMQATAPCRGLDQPKAEPVTRAHHTGRQPCALVRDQQTELADWLTVDTGRHALGQWSDQQLSSSSAQRFSSPDMLNPETFSMSLSQPHGSFYVQADKSETEFGWTEGRRLLSVFWLSGRRCN